jgi:YVTN family beta-propeller protein
VLANVTVGFQPHGIAVNPVTDLIYVTNTASNSVSVIDGKTNKIIDTIMIGNRNLADDFEFTSHVAVNSKTNRVYVSNIDADTVTVIYGKTDKILPLGIATLQASKGSSR